MCAIPLLMIGRKTSEKMVNINLSCREGFYEKSISTSVLNGLLIYFELG